ncbi:MAG: polysaccharide pyruvyl transferase family protein [Prevotella sp.]|nr:polysaccharide pyruvyl transferase family protein [Prevotella sp.]
MKIGIITLWESSDNYGQQLQCWALQEVLRELGQDPFLIRYNTALKPSLSNRIKSKLNSIIKIISIYQLIRKIYERKKNKNKLRWQSEYKKKNNYRDFAGFKKQYLTISPEIYEDVEALRSNPPQAEIYIAGSDQIWSYPLSYEESKAYFLDFGSENIKRIAYAASFSLTEYPENLKPVLRHLLKRFDAVSVREDTGVSICESVGIKAELVVDPTMLLGINDYKILIQQNQLKEDDSNYIYVYHLNIEDKEEIHWEEVKKLALNNTLSLRVTTSSGQLIGRELLDGVDYEYSTIPQWLSNISNAKFVVTTSFHGVVFCLIFHINFIWFPLMGKRSNGNCRVIDLLKSINLSNHIFSETNTLEKVYTLPIDWDVVDIKLNSLRGLSLSFLQKALNI